MQDIKDMIDALSSGDKTGAKDLLHAVIYSKCVDRINAMKPNIAQQMFQKEQK